MIDSQLWVPRAQSACGGRRSVAGRVRRRARLADCGQSVPRRVRRARASGGSTAAEAGKPFAALNDGAQIIGEEFVEFTRELSASSSVHRPGRRRHTRSRNRCSETASASRRSHLRHASMMSRPRQPRSWPHDRARARGGRDARGRADAARGRIGGGQRARHAAAQHRPLDDRWCSYFAVREPPARGARPPLGDPSSKRRGP